MKALQQFGVEMVRADGMAAESMVFSRIAKTAAENTSTKRRSQFH